MNQRFLVFMLVAFALLMLNNIMMQPVPPKDGEKDAAADKDGEAKDPKDNDGKPDAADDPDSNPDKKPPKKDDDQPKKPALDEGPREPRRLTLGSIDPESGYAMLVTLTTEGAAIERVELSNPQFRDIDDRGGYLGNLAPSDSTEKLGPGCLVHVVGDGTPAQEAGLRAGDLITAVNTVTVGGRQAFLDAMSNTKPGQQITLNVQRDPSANADAEPLELPVTLIRRPLEVCRPEEENFEARKETDRPKEHVDHPSLLMTLHQIGNDRLGEDDVELPGVDMRSGHWEVVPGETNSDVSFRRVLAEHEVEVIKHYWLEKVEDALTYHLRFEIKIKNLADKEREIAYRLDGPTGLPTEGYWYSSKISPNWFDGAGMRDYVRAQRNAEGHITDTTFISAKNVTDDDFGDAPGENDQQSLAYIGVDAQYFAAALLPEAREGDAIRFATAQPLLVGGWNGNYKNRANISTRLTSTPVKLAPGASTAQNFRFFAGPKQPEVLEKYQMQNLIVYGWFGWVSKPMTSLLHVLRHVGGFGLAIVLLTVIVRLCMFPLSRKQVMGAQKMQQLQPEMKKLSEKYKEDRPTLAKKQQELFRRHNYNPLSGCLVLFIQLPIFIGLYRALSIDIELRDAGLFGNSTGWCSNLTAPDMLLSWSSWMPGFIQGMLGPYLNVLPLITVVLFLVQQKMFMPPPADETAAMQQKVMTFMMIFIGFMFYRVASGLCVYFIVSSVWGIVERKVLPKTTAGAVEEIAPTPDPSKHKAIGNSGNRSKAKKKKKGR